VQKAWDHAIELKEGFAPRKGKVYSLSREEREEVQAFVEDQLGKGYIQPSKSPQTLMGIKGNWSRDKGDNKWE